MKGYKATMVWNVKTAPTDDIDYDVEEVRIVADTITEAIELVKLGCPDTTIINIVAMGGETYMRSI